MCSTASTDFIIWILLLQTQTQTGLGKKKYSPPARLVGKMGFGVVIVNDYNNDQVEARVPVPDQRTWQTNMRRSY